MHTPSYGIINQKKKKKLINKGNTMVVGESLFVSEFQN